MEQSKLKFSVGYRLSSDKRFADMIVREKEHIGEVYFSWGDFPNGRNSQDLSNEYSPWEIQREFEKDIKRFADEGLKFNLLFNGNCYGGDALARSLFNKIGDTVDYIEQNYGLASVTTTSPVIAKFLKANFERIDVRASVNMGIGNICSMDYVAHLFDSFYLKREHNRNLCAIKEISSWCKASGKGLYMLANSGCLNHCSAHTFHDNLVAHENESSTKDNAYVFSGICHEYVANPQKRASLIRDTSFVRPEDLHLYDEYFDGVKLATRVHSNPCSVLSAYINGKFYGGITDLLEPSHSGIILPQIIDNRKFPGDFAKTVMNCNKNCSECGYCDKVYENVLSELGGVSYLEEDLEV